MHKDGRCHIRLPEELKNEIKSYARRHNTTMNVLIEQHFRRLLAEEQKDLLLSDIEIGEQIG